jgi:uncharacterized protein YndB with AHSA1/START domain
MAGQTKVVERVLPSDLVITRTFDATREQVFDMWTNRERLEHWYAPSGCTISFPKLDVRQGGQFHSCIRTPDGHDCWCVGVYQDIVWPERLVFTLASADALGNRVAPEDAGMHPDWPAEMIVTVTFTEQNGKTVMTLHQTVPEALAKATGAYPSWISMLDRLETEIAL